MVLLNNGTVGWDRIFFVVRHEFDLLTIKGRWAAHHVRALSACVDERAERSELRRARTGVGTGRSCVGIAKTWVIGRRGDVATGDAVLLIERVAVHSVSVQRLLVQLFNQLVRVWRKVGRRGISV